MTRILKIAKRILIWFFILSAGSVILLRFVPVYFTPLMGIRCAQQAFSGEKLKLKHKWMYSYGLHHHGYAKDSKPISRY